MCSEQQATIVDVETQVEFASVSGFALAGIHKVNPGRQAVDGWLRVKQKETGRLLKELREDYYSLMAIHNR